MWVTHSKNLIRRVKKMTTKREIWLSIKQQNPQSIVLVRIGKFYEVFEDDAMILHDVFQAPLLDNQKHTGFPASCLDKFINGLQEASIRLI